jgi:O-antigen ligase
MQAYAAPALPPSAASGGRREVPLLYIAAGVPLVTAGFANLAALWRAGPVSGMGAETLLEVLLAVGAAVVAARWPRPLLVRTAPFGAFLVWSVIRSLLDAPTFEGAQNALVYLLFCASLMLAGTIAGRDPRGAATGLGRGMEWMQGVALAVAAANLLVYGFPHGGNWLVGPRSLALVALIGVNWQLAAWATGRTRAIFPAVVLYAAVLLSASRTASAIGLLSFGVVVALLAPSRPRRAAAGLVVLSLALGSGAALVAFAPPFHARFFSGDTKLHVAGYAVNVSGRAAFWRVMVRSASERPLVGHGLGSSQQVMAAEFFDSDNIRHPHNDYLRVWHDLGAIGLALAVGALLLWLAALFRGWRLAWRAGDPSRALQLAALLTLVELLLAMITDNVLIYPFFMGAAGIVIGTAFGTDVALRARLPRHARRR